jgi:hypothetical protein
MIIRRCFSGDGLLRFAQCELLRHMHIGLLADTISSPTEPVASSMFYAVRQASCYPVPLTRRSEACSKLSIKREGSLVAACESCSRVSRNEERSVDYELDLCFQAPQPVTYCKVFIRPGITRVIPSWWGLQALLPAMLFFLDSPR